MKVFVATPLYNQVTAEYAQSLMMAALDCKERGIEIVPNIVRNSCFVDIARRVLVKNFLETDCTHRLFIDSDIGYDDNSLEDQFAILGLSDSANVVAFYDKNNWIVRAAWNWRDEFLSATCCGGLGQPNPLYTEEYDQLDAIVSYTFGNGITLFAEGFNLTDEYLRLRGRNPDMLRFVTQTGRRYGLGVRWTY